MPLNTRPQISRRASASVQHIRSPLTRVGFALAPASAHLVLLLAGRTGLRRDGAEMHFQAEGPRLIWRAEGSGEELVAEGGARGTIISVPGLALMRALPATPFGGQMRHTLGQSFSLPLENPARFSPLVDGLESERANAEPGSEVAGAHYLALLLVQLWRLARADLVVHDHSPRGLAERFVQLAAQHAREHWRVADYANAIGVSRDRLGAAVLRATGLSPQRYLHRELLREASELLANTGLAVGQIAFRLGFQDPAYFTRFFTRQTGQSPAQFRRTAPPRQTQDEQPYAAWP